jgi:hypothetical protein
LGPKDIAALLLVIVAPAAFALEAQAAVGRLLGFGAPAIALLVVRAAVTILGLVAGLALRRGDEGGWRLVRAWSVAAAGATLVTFLTPYFPSNRAPGEKRLALAAWLLVYAAWFVIAHTRGRAR